MKQNIIFLAIKLILSVNKCSVFALLAFPNPDIVSDCVSGLISKLFVARETLGIIFEEQDELLYSDLILNPRLIIATNSFIEPTTVTCNNYVMYTKGINFNITMASLKNSSIWNESESSKGKFLVITSDSDTVKNIFQVLWSFDVTKAIVITHNKKNSGDSLPKMYTCDSSGEFCQCGPQVKSKFIGYCNKKANQAIFYSKVLNMRGCQLQIVMPDDVFWVEDNILMDIILKPLISIIATKLKINVSYSFTEYSNIKATLYNHTQDISISPKFYTAPKFYVDYDLSEVFYTDDMAWIVPKPQEVMNLKVLDSVFTASVWWMTCLTVCITSMFWWFIARQVAEKNEFKELSKTFLVTSAWIFGKVSNLQPTTIPLRILSIFYLLYCVHINHVFQGRLISVYVQPAYDDGIQSMEDLANSKLIALIPDKVNKVILRKDSEYEYLNLQPRYITEFKRNLTDNVIKVAYDRNYTTSMGKRMFIKMYPNEKSMLTIIEERTRLVQMEMTVAMRKGHYFMQIFNKLVRRVVESGISEKWYTISTYQYRNDNEDVVVLTRQHLYGAFVWLIAGLSTALTHFFVEHMIYHWPKMNYHNEFVKTPNVM